MTTKRAHIGRSGLALLGAALVAACSPATPRPPQSVGISRCTVAYDERTLAECKHLALVKGDGKAALAVAKYYESPRHVSNDSAVEWYERAANLGQLTAYRKLFDAYYYGSIAPPNIAKADEYLRRASEAGVEWAVLIVAKRLESSDPKAAVDRYLKLASDGNCYAQGRMADLYARDDFSGRSLTH